MRCSEQTRKEGGKLLQQSAGERNEGALADVEALAAELMALSPEAASRRVSTLQLDIYTCAGSLFNEAHGHFLSLSKS